MRRIVDLPLDGWMNTSDEDLLQDYAMGDRRASEILTARLLPRVYGQSYRLLGDSAEAEDVAQEAMMRLWRIAPDWRRGEAQVSTWLYRVTANLCTDRLRKRRGVDMDAIPEPADTNPSVVSKLQDQSRQDALYAAIAQLPDRQGEAVTLRHIDGLSNPEIAEIMEITPRAVESLTARGKRALSEILTARRSELGYEND